MEETMIIPVFYHNDIEICKKVIKACYNGGIRVFEFTNRSDFAHETFGELSRWVSISLSDMILGAGSIIDAGTTSLYMQLGANFIVSPLFNPEMARVCNRRKVLWVPGCGSLSEISNAEELGAEICKILPVSSVGGPGFLKAVKGPSPWTKLMPTGGVEPTTESIGEWLKAGVTCVGMGSKLITQKILEKGLFNELESKVKETMDIIRSFKKDSS